MSLVFLLGVFLPGRAMAHRADYIDETLVYLTVEAGGLEPEYWLDFGSLRDIGTFVRHNLSLEYGLTDHWMVEGRGTFNTPGGEATNFDSARVETRYRFLEEGEKPVDFALSAEVNTQRLGDGTYQQGLEPRLILSRDFDALNLTLNLSEEIPLAPVAAEFNAAFGIRYNTHSFFNLGSELKYDLASREGAVIPQAWFKLAPAATFKAAYSAPFDQNLESFLRLVIEIEFATGPAKPDKDDD